MAAHNVWDVVQMYSHAVIQTYSRCRHVHCHTEIHDSEMTFYIGSHTHTMSEQVEPVPQSEEHGHPHKPDPYRYGVERCPTSSITVGLCLSVLACSVHQFGLSVCVCVCVCVYMYICG